MNQTLSFVCNCELNEFTSWNDECFQVSIFLYCLISLSAPHERERVVSLFFEWACLELECLSWWNGCKDLVGASSLTDVGYL